MAGQMDATIAGIGPAMTVTAMTEIVTIVTAMIVDADLNEIRLKVNLEHVNL